MKNALILIAFALSVAPSWASIKITSKSTLACTNMDTSVVIRRQKGELVMEVYDAQSSDGIIEEKVLRNGMKLGQKEVISYEIKKRKLDVTIDKNADSTVLTGCLIGAKEEVIASNLQCDLFKF